MIEVEPGVDAIQPVPSASKNHHLTVHDHSVDEEVQHDSTIVEQSLLRRRFNRRYDRISQVHARTPYIRRLPLNSILIIAILVLINVLIWAIILLILLMHNPPYPGILSTAALAYSLGLRHALDADHISAIDLMTRRLIATGQRPATVGTFFSLGHSTVVIITCIVVAATTAGISKRFGNFSTIGGIIGSAISASFLIVLGLMNAYILYRLILQLRKVIHLSAAGEDESEAWKLDEKSTRSPLFRILKRLFKLIDKPWKMYPLGFTFGLGFDTSSEIALLGIASLQGAKGTSIWLILIFPVLFTAGMCLIDTIDGALMAGIYLAGMTPIETATSSTTETKTETVTPESPDENGKMGARKSKKNSPLTFLYYSSVLTALTVVVALVIGVIQLLTLILNVAVSAEQAETVAFWRGVNEAGQYYYIIGAGICGSFVIVGIASVVCYRPFIAWVESKRQEGGTTTAAAERVEVHHATEHGDEENGDGTAAAERPMENKDLDSSHGKDIAVRCSAGEITVAVADADPNARSQGYVL